MANNSYNRFLTAFIALAFFFIFACSSDGESGALDGTWEKDELTLEISGNTYLFKYDGENETKGTVTYTDNTFEFTITDQWTWRSVRPKWEQASGKYWGKYVRNGDVSAFSEVYTNVYGTAESADDFNGEWKKIR